MMYEQNGHVSTWVIPNVRNGSHSGVNRPAVYAIVDHATQLPHSPKDSDHHASAPLRTWQSSRRRSSSSYRTAAGRSGRPTPPRSVLAAALCSLQPCSHRESMPNTWPCCTPQIAACSNLPEDANTGHARRAEPCCVRLGVKLP